MVKREISFIGGGFLEASYLLLRQVVFMQNGGRLIKTTSEAKMCAIIVKFEDWEKVSRNTVPVELQATTPLMPPGGAQRPLSLRWMTVRDFVATR